MKHQLLPSKLGCNNLVFQEENPTRKTIIFMINFKNMLQIFDLIHIFTLSAFLIDPSYQTECKSFYYWVILIRDVWRTIFRVLVAVFHSDFRTKNGAHTDLTMIPNSRKQVPSVFLLADWDSKRWPIPLRSYIILFVLPGIYTINTW